jgi:hypothetical protein
MPFTYKNKKNYLAPPHYFVNVGLFNYFGRFQNPLITLSKWRFQLRYACFSPWMDSWSLHTCLVSLGSTKPTRCTDYNSSLMLPFKEHGFFIHLWISQFEIVVIAKTILNRLRHRHLRYNLVVVNPLNLSKLFCDKLILIDGCLSVSVYSSHQIPFLPKSLLGNRTWILSRIIYGSQPFLGLRSTIASS